MNKIEAAEALAKAVYETMANGGHLPVRIRHAVDEYNCASVPSNEELGRVACQAWDDARCPDSQLRFVAWDEVGKAMRSRWTAAAAAVREWVQRDGLTDEERQRIVKLIQANEPFQPEIDYSILRKLGREPEPVWEWDEEYGTLCLYSAERVSLAEVSLMPNGLQATVFPTKQHTKGSAWTVVDAKAWCEQQLREARQ